MQQPDGSKKTSAFWMVFFLAISSLFLNFSAAMAQNYYTRHFTVTDGLPNSAIQSLYKDSSGLLWIGTNAALCTFDGKEFKVIKTQNGKTLNQIWSITEDNSGNMWFGSKTEGIYKYDGQDFKRYTNDNGLSDNQIRFIYYSKKFDLIAACSYAGANIIKNDTIITSPDWMGSMDSTTILTSIADGTDFLYFASVGLKSLVRYYPQNNKFTPINPGSKIPPAPGFSLYITSAGDTIFSHYTIGISIVTKDSIISDMTIGQVFNMDQDREGNVWMPSWSTKNRNLREGVFRYDGKEFRNFQSEFGITDKEIWSVYCDTDQDLIWIGTINDGLYLIMKNEITTFDSGYFDLKGLQINDLFVDSKNTLWISDNNEMIRLFPDGQHSVLNKRPMTRAFQDYWRISQRKVFAAVDEVQRSLRTLDQSKLSEFEKETPFEFLRIIEDDDNKIFFSNRFGIFSFADRTIDYHCSEGSEGFFEIMQKDTLILAGSGPAVFNSQFRDKSANIFLTKEDSLKNTTLYYPLESFSPDSEILRVNKIVKHSNKIFYATASDGLWMTEGVKYINLTRSDSTISSSLNDICFTPQGSIIFASNEGEIYIGNLEGKSLKIEHRLDYRQGLQGNSINWLVVDKKGFLWAGSNIGLNCIDLNALYSSNTYKIRFFDKEEGYFGQGSQNAAMDQNGNLFIAAKNTLIEINTQSELVSPENHVQNRIVLGSLLINEEVVDKMIIKALNNNTASLDDILKLSYTQNNFEFHFDILNYINPNKDKFRYKLTGFDRTWRNWDDARQAKYTSLPAGKYQFTVESMNQHTLLKAVALNIKFTIPKPFWELWYFQLISLMILIFLVIIITKIIVDRKRLRQIRNVEVERKIMELEMQALQAQMNPHFIFNCLTGIQYYVLENKTDEVMSYLSDFARVIRSSLENANHNNTPVANEIKFLQSYLRLEQMRFEEKFEYEIISKNIPNSDSIRIPAMMVQPFAENSIKHGFSNLDRKGRLTIEFEMHETDTIKCTISDNGKGRDMSEARIKSFLDSDRIHSSSITDKRIQLLNTNGQPDKFKVQFTDLFDEGEPCGLKVEVYLPVG